MFDRTSNSLKLSECGKIFWEAVERADSELKKAKIDMLNSLGMPKGEIKLLILTNRRVVTDVIAKFRLDYPDVTFSIKHEDYDDYNEYYNYDIIISDRNIESSLFTRKDFVHEEVFLAVPEKKYVIIGFWYWFEKYQQRKIYLYAKRKQSP